MYMGMHIGEDGLKPDQDKIQVITEMPNPTNKKQYAKIPGHVKFLVSIHTEQVHILSITL